MPSWDDLRIFLAVRRAATLAGAARALGVDQTTVSRRLTALERDLGAKLFHRVKSGVIPTEAGERILADAEGMEAAALAAERKLSGEDARLSGALRVTSSESFATRLIAPALPSFHRLHPAIVVELHVTIHTLNLSRREADVALRTTPPAQPNLVARKVGELGFALYGGAAAVERRGRARDVEADDLLGFGDELAGLAEARWLAGSGARRIVARSNSLTALAALAAAGIGLAVLPCILGDGAAGLRRAGPVLGSRTLWLVAHREMISNARVRAMLDHLSAWLRERAGEISGAALAA
jgi:DNA-binding transcriptional LysR family regulator